MYSQRFYKSSPLRLEDSVIPYAGLAVKSVKGGDEAKLQFIR